MNGINVKAAVKWVKGATKGQFFVDREGETLLMTDGVVVIEIPESTAWDIVKALPSPLPSGDGEFIYRAGSVEKEESRIRHLVKGHIPTNYRPATDTRLTINRSYGQVRLYHVGEGYTALDQSFIGLFDDYTEKRVPDNLTIRNGIANCLVAFYAGGEFVGMVLPLMDVILPEYLRTDIPATTTGDTAAD